MNIHSIFLTVYSLLMTHQLIGLGVLAVLALILWRKPIVFLKFTLVILSLCAVIYVGSLLGDAGESGVSYKHQGIESSEKDVSK